MPAAEPARVTLPRWAPPAAAAALLLACLAGFAAYGGPQGPIDGLAVVVETLIVAGLPAAAYLLGAVGLGEVFGPLVRRSREAAALRAALGLGLMLSLSHALGWAGLLSGAVGMVVGAGVCLAGLVLLGARIRKDWSRFERPSPLWVLGIPAAALMLVAACNAPGWLWDSEGGGYDALSYHLQLPQEWIRLGRLQPLEHNVYSFLPGYVEAAFYHLAAMTGAPEGPTAGSRAWGLLAGSGARVLSCQLLSAGIAVFAAVMIARLARCAAARVRGDAPGQRFAGAAAGVLLLSTPWTVVVGSLAYNDLGVVALLAGAMIAAMDDELRPAARGALTGLLVGFACGCKPTALFMAGVPAGIVLLWCADRRAWPVVIGAGAAAGLAAIAPWLVRNWTASGNPVFPFAASVFGSGHWTAEQMARYATGHRFDGSVIERFRLLVLPDPNDPAGTVHRGLMHPQWFAFYPLVAVAGAIGLAPKVTRRVTVMLVAALIGSLLAWWLLTHIQSRFLLPVAAPGGALIGVAVAVMPRRIGAASAAIAALLQLGAAAWVFMGERGGSPNALLLGGPAARTGELFTPEQRRVLLPEAGPEHVVNFTVEPGRTVYLLGDATPLYYAADVRYNTTWDRWLMGEAIRSAPDDPAAWTRALRREGVSLVLVSFGELERLTRSGWADPAVTPRALEAWLASGVRVVRRWPEEGWLLVELPAEGAP